MKRSRLSRRLEKQSRKNILVTLLGIIIIVVTLVKFGIPLLVDFSLFLADKKGQNTSVQKASFVSPPILDHLFNATNSANINVSGVAGSKQIIKLYINDNLIGEKNSDSDGIFNFENVRLPGVQNVLKAKAIWEKSESEYSKEISIIFKDSKPALSVDSPTDNQTFPSDSSSIEVKGKTDPGIKVTVNDFWAIVDENGNFSYWLSLKNGENIIKTIAIDEAGNKTEKEIKVTYSQ